MMQHGMRRWRPEKLGLKPLHLLLSLLITATAFWVTAWILPGVEISSLTGALLVALFVGVVNAIVPPFFAALRLPVTLVLSFPLTIVLNASVLRTADRVLDSFTIDSFGWALLAAIMVAGVSVVLEVILSVNDDVTYTLRVVQSVARRQGGAHYTDEPGILFLEIDGLALPVLRRAMRDGNAPNMARWMLEKTHRLIEWEPDLSSQTGASQAGILHGCNDNIPAFRWVEKGTGRLISFSTPADCARIERERANGNGLLVDGGASRGNLLSGEAEEVILTVSRLDAETRPNPGYRAFFANGFNVSRAIVLYIWELILEWTAAIRAERRDIRPRGPRGGLYPFIRAAMCVIVRDLIVYGVLTDMMRGRPAVYATVSSYDEVAHPAGLERADTLEALRKLDQQFGRIERARRYAPRPYEIVVLSDHGQTQGATFRQRNGYGLDELVERSVEAVGVETYAGGDEQERMVGLAIDEATGRTGKRAEHRKEDVPDRQVIVLGSGNLGLIYLMEEPRRLTLEEIEARHPRLIPALRSHPHIGWILVRSAERGAVVLGPRGAHYLNEGRVEGEDPLAPFSPNAPRHLLRTDSFPDVADIVVGSFYNPEMDEGCAFEELISFHGGIGGPQTQPFILAPVTLPVPDEPLVGAEAVHGLLKHWRRLLHGDLRPRSDVAEPAVAAIPATGAFD